MDDNLNDIKTFFTNNYSHTLESITKLSSSNTTPPKPLVSNALLAFNFDTITKENISVGTPCSVDCLYFSDKANFIEFKSGLQNCKSAKYDVIINNLNMKAVESIRTFKDTIIPVSIIKNDLNIIKTLYIVVIDSVQYASTALAVAYASSASKESELEQSLSRFKTKDNKGNKIYYDDVKVWTDISFNSMVASL